MTADRARYRVLTDELNWPADAAIVARLRAGESIPMDKRGRFAPPAAGRWCPTCRQARWAGWLTWG